MFLFYGDGLTYFFVSNFGSDSPSDEISPENNVKNSPNTLSAPSNLKPNLRQSENLNTVSKLKSSVYKTTQSKEIGDKGLQILHEGLNIRQILLGRIGLDYLVYMRKFSSHSMENMRKYYRESKKTFNRVSGVWKQVVSNVLVILEHKSGPIIGKMLFIIWIR